MTRAKPSQLAISQSVPHQEVAAIGRDVFAMVNAHCRRSLGIKFFETLPVDQPMTVRLRRDESDHPQTRCTVVTFDLQVVPVETMRVVMRELEPPRVMVHRPVTPPPKTPGVFGRLWNGWKKHVDQCRESLGG